MLHNHQFIAKHRNHFFDDKINALNFLTIKNSFWQIKINPNEIIKTTDDKEIILLGPCFSLNTQESAIDKLQKCETITEVLNQAMFLGGRWVLFWNKFIITDASGNFQLFWVKKDGIAVSSSLSLLAAEFNLVCCPTRRLEMESIGFYPAPNTIYPDINVLLSFQVINASDIEVRPNYNYRGLESFTKDQLIEGFIVLTKNFIENIKRENVEIITPLTGGIDSRTILAFLLNFYPRIETYTTWFPSINIDDFIIPKLLSLFFPKVKHKIIRPKAWQNTRAKKFDVHTGGNCVERDRSFYATNSYPMKPDDKKAIMIRGAGWAPFKWKNRQFYAKSNCFDDLEDIINQIIIKYDIPSESCARNSIKDWLQIVRNANIVNWRLQSYIDHRLNAWDGSISQAIQITGYHTINLINSQIQIDYMVSYYDKFENDNKKDVFQLELINRLNHSLMYFPVNFFKNTSKLSKKLKKRLINKTKYIFKCI